MSVSDQELLHHLSRMPFVDTAELAMILGEAHATVHRGLTELLSEGMVGRRQPRHRTPVVEPAVLPDGEGRQQSRRSPRLRHAIRLR